MKKYSEYAKRLPTKWTKEGRRVFREVYEVMADNQSVLIHPQAEQVTPRLWGTVAWNAAWVAAESAQGIWQEESD